MELKKGWTGEEDDVDEDEDEDDDEGEDGVDTIYTHVCTLLAHRVDFPPSFSVQHMVPHTSHS